MALAERERDFKTDDVGAARVLDKVLARYAGDDSPDYRRALEARIELAEVHDESERADDRAGRIRYDRATAHQRQRQ